MLLKIYIALALLSSSYASPTSGLPYILPGLTNDGAQTATIANVGTDSKGHTTYSIGLAIPFVTASTGTVPDTTITAAATLVDGPSDAHLIEVFTVAGKGVTYSEGCTLEKGNAVCTLVGHLPTTTVSTVLTVTSSATGLSVVTASAKNSARRIGVSAPMTMFSSMAVVVGGIVLGAIIGFQGY